MRKIIVFVGMILFFGTSFCLAAEEITITTYYPSPYGVYRELELGALGTAISTVTQESSGEIALTGSYWTGAAETKHKFNLRNIASITVNEEGRLGILWDSSELVSIKNNGNVGIGMSPTANKLDVNGAVNATSYSAGGTAGHNGDITVGDGAAGTCTITVTNGIITATTCS